jgi:hypothetical protein
MLTTSQVATVAHVLEKLFDSQREEWKEELTAAEFEQRRHDFVFHMTDWKDDLLRLADWIRSPQTLDEENASAQWVGFLYHVIPHLNSAGRLLLGDVADPFAGTTPGK